MKSIKIFITFAWLLPLSLSGQLTDQTAGPTAQAQLEQSNALNSDIASFASVLFNPVSGTTAQPVPTPYPTDSINSALVDSFYGQLQIQEPVITYLKNFYFFIEYCTKLEIAARLAALAPTLSIDINGILESADQQWTGLVDQINKSTGGWSATLQAARDLPTIPATAFTTIRGSIIAATWQDVPQSSFWKAITVTSEDIIKSDAWQSYIKYLITQTFSQTQTILTQIKQSEDMIFKYIPNLEVAYYQPEFTNLRNSAELLRVNLLLIDNIRNQAHAQSTDWSMLDMKQTCSATLDYSNNSVYFKKLYFAEQNPTSILYSTTGLQSAISNDDLAADPLLVEKITVYSMIKVLQTLTEPLFSSANLLNTMQKLPSQQPEPSILLFSTSDQTFLEDRNTISDSAQQAQSNTTVAYSTQKTAHDPFIEIADWSSFWNDLKTAVVDAGKAVGELVVGAGEAIASLAEKPIAAIVGVFSPSAGQKIEEQSTELWQKANDEFEKSKTDAISTITYVAAAAEEVVGAGAQLIGDVISTFDPKLGADIAGTLSTLGIAAIEAVETEAVVWVSTGYAAIQLAVGACEAIGDVIADSVISIASGGAVNAWGSDWASMKSFASDFASSLLSTISFVGTLAFDVFNQLVMSVGYITSAVVDILYKVIDGFAYIGAAIASAFDTDIDPSAVASQVDSFLEDHRKFSEAVVNTAILIGVSIVTGGAGGVAMMAMNAGMGLFQIIGGEQSDEARQQDKEDQKKFLTDYTSYVETNSTILQQQMNDWSTEFGAKLQAQISNQERGLGFYQNYMSSYAESIKQSTSMSLGAFLAPQLKVQDNGLIFADVGALYGLTTGTYNLNPSQGFPLYNKGRSAFSQEIAVAPITLPSDQSTGSQSFTDQTVIEKFWFNQKETIPLATAPQEVEIRFKGVYVLDSYYIGLYFGGQPFDIQTIIDTNKAPVDPAFHAKMLVYNKLSSNAPTSCGLYEHEGKGWLSQNLSAPTFTPGEWYRMKMQLNGNLLNVKVWKDSDNEPSGQPFQVTIDKDNLELKTIGIISSGAAVEYQIITPQITIKTNSTVRPAATSFEQTREVTARQSMNRLESPLISSSLPLQALDLTTLVKGLYIYTTKVTGLTDQNGNPINDYVLLCQIGNDNKVIASSIGLSIEQTGASGIVSLVTGNYYNANAQKVGYYADIFNVYNVYHGPLSTSVTNAIQAQRKIYLQKYIGPFTFGTIQLNATSIDDIAQGNYVYKGISPEAELVDANNAAVVDSSTGKTIYDYFVVASLDTKNNVLNYGVAYDDPKANGILSLVTGKVYSSTSPTAVNSGYSLDLTMYGDELANLIKTSQTYYNNQLTAEQISAQINKQLQATIQLISTMSTGPLSGTQPIPAGKTDPSGADQSLANNLVNAAQGDTGGF
jgi:hypothetical protein